MNDFAETSPLDDVTRALPHSIGAEKSVLSSMLADPREFIGRAVEEGITEGHFYLPAHGTLFGVLVDLWNRGKEIEVIALTQILLDRGELDRIGGPANLMDIYGYAVTNSHFGRHLRIVKDKHALRSAVLAANETIAEAYDGPEDVSEFLDALEARVMAIRESGSSSAEEPLSAVLERVNARVEAQVRGDEESFGLATGFEGLSHKGIYLKPGEMFVIAARPSMGKTAIMMNAVESVAIDRSGHVLVFSSEMDKDALIERLVCSRGKFPIAAIRKREHTATKHDLIRYRQAATDIAAARMPVIDKPQITVGEIRAIARRKHREKPLDLIAIDYLQYLRSNSKQAQYSREREIAEISAGLKALAKELKVPILLLAQLNREADKRTGKNHGIPRMSDLRESGAIEQDADIIGLLHRADYYAGNDAEREELAGQARLIIAKNRNGETGDVPLTFISAFARFEDGAPVPELPMNQPMKSRFDD